MTGDSCISQLLSIVHAIQSSFDYKLPVDVRAIFVDISKVFDEVWHQSLLCKLKSYGVEGNFLRLLENYLDNRKQRAILHGKCSSCKIILSGVPHGSVLGPLLFLICINDLPNDLNSNCKIFADDTSIFSKVFDEDKSQRDHNNDLSIISEWAFQWNMQFNPDTNKQTNEFYFSRKSNTDGYIPIKLNDSPVQLCESQKHLAYRDKN